MPERVTGFPFSWTSAPMYDGSTLLFVAKAVAENSPVGLVLAAWVYVVYALARAAEEYVGSPRPLLRARRAGGRGRRADLGWTDPRVAPRGTGSRQGGMARGAPRPLGALAVGTRGRCHFRGVRNWQPRLSSRLCRRSWGHCCPA